MLERPTLSFGWDDERPYGPLAQTEKGRAFREEKLQHYLPLMNKHLDREAIPRTHFLLGDYLEQAVQDGVLPDLFREFYTGNPLLEVGQHSYSHGIMEPLEGVDKPPMTAVDYIADLQRAQTVIQEILGVTPKGLRTPYGYEEDRSDRPDILKGVQDIGLHYISSALGDKKTLYGKMTPERQPHHYGAVGFPDIVEMPSHGYQDAVFVPANRERFLQRSTPLSADDILRSYDDILDQTLRLDQPASVNLCLHPWAGMEFDSDMEIMLRIADSGRRKGFEILTYGQVAEKYKQK